MQSTLVVVTLRYRDTLRLWKICVDERKLHPTEISINRHKRLAHCVYVCTLSQCAQKLTRLVYRVRSETKSNVRIK